MCKYRADFFQIILCVFYIILMENITSTRFPSYVIQNCCWDVNNTYIFIIYIYIFPTCRMLFEIFFYFLFTYNSCCFSRSWCFVTKGLNLKLCLLKTEKRKIFWKHIFKVFFVIPMYGRKKYFITFYNDLYI